MVTQYKNLIGGEMIGTDRWLDVGSRLSPGQIGALHSKTQSLLWQHV